ncbi:hypothetical protein BDB01DRAFT_847567 [Pilobolus umbonatus]|nr:hypothetical protein BDB01DRAFT_847567 [Pilobolus umbonatus]
MNDFLPSRSWIPPLMSSPDSFTTCKTSLTSSSLPTPPQPDLWKSPPYNSRSELSRDSSYTAPQHKQSPLLSTSPIIQTLHSSRPAPPELSSISDRRRSSHFQYTSKYPTNSIDTNDSHTEDTTQSAYFNVNTYPTRLDSDIDEVVKQCNTLRQNMLQRKSQFIDYHSNTVSNKEVEMTQPWLEDMIGRANEVLNALLRLRKHQIATEQMRSTGINNRRSSEFQVNYELAEHNNADTWHNKLSGNNGNRQRKRGKRAAFQGRCHSCNISETPEWRRGPDGARTLCNACGLHYAKLSRKHQQSNSNHHSSNHHNSNHHNKIILNSSIKHQSNENKYSSSKSTSPMDDRLG